MPTLTLTLPLPPRELSPNARVHWAKKSRAKQSWKTDIYWCVWEQVFKCIPEDDPKYAMSPYIPETSKATIHLDWYMAGHGNGDDLLRPTDVDNCIAAWKSGQDQLVDSGLLMDDNAKYVQIGRVNLYRQKKDHKGRCELVVTLEWEE